MNETCAAGWDFDNVLGGLMFLIFVVWFFFHND